MTVAETRDYALRRGPVSPRPSLSPPLPWRPENLRPTTLRQASAASSRSLGTSLFVRQGQRGRGTRWATQLSSAPSSSGDCHQVKNITLKIIQIFWLYLGELDISISSLSTISILFSIPGGGHEGVIWRHERGDVWEETAKGSEEEELICFLLYY